MSDAGGCWACGRAALSAASVFVVVVGIACGDSRAGIVAASVWGHNLTAVATFF